MILSKDCHHSSLVCGPWQGAQHFNGLCSHLSSLGGRCHAHAVPSPQVCSILWSSHYKELISGHGFAQNQLVIWKYPTMAKVAELKGRWLNQRQATY